MDIEAPAREGSGASSFLPAIRYLEVGSPHASEGRSGELLPLTGSREWKTSGASCGAPEILRWAATQLQFAELGMHFA